jgi:hypothetical protein
MHNSQMSRTRCISRGIFIVTSEMSSRLPRNPSLSDLLHKGELEVFYSQNYSPKVNAPGAGVPETSLRMAGKWAPVR